MAVTCGKQRLQVTTNNALFLCHFCLVLTLSCLVVAEAFRISFLAFFRLHPVFVRQVSSLLMRFLKVVSLEQICRRHKFRLYGIDH